MQKQSQYRKWQASFWIWSNLWQYLFAFILLSKCTSNELTHPEIEIPWDGWRQSVHSERSHTLHHIQMTARAFNLTLIVWRKINWNELHSLFRSKLTIKFCPLLATETMKLKEVCYCYRFSMQHQAEVPSQRYAIRLIESLVVALGCYCSHYLELDDSDWVRKTTVV